MTEQQVTDTKSFWSALGVRATGVAIVTAHGEGGPSGFLALSATHLAASPPTMTISVSLTTSAYADIVDSGHFAEYEHWAVSKQQKEKKLEDAEAALNEAIDGAQKFGGLSAMALMKPCENSLSSVRTRHDVEGQLISLAFRVRFFSMSESSIGDAVGCCCLRWNATLA